MAHIVHCRVCKRDIDVDRDTDWMIPARNQYYHCECYHEWLSKREERVTNVSYTDDEWKALLYDYIWKDIKLPNADFEKISSQWNNFIKKNFTPKGIYFAILYYYEVAHGDADKAQGGIGIVSSIYRESAEYWINREYKREGTLNGIIEQMKARAERNNIVLKTGKNSGRDRSRFSLDDI